MAKNISIEEMRARFLSGMNIELPELKTYEYKLMYFYAGWHLAERIIAEDDYEAIHDADEAPKKGINTITYALFRGNKKVKVYLAEQFEEGLNGYFTNK